MTTLPASYQIPQQATPAQAAVQAAAIRVFQRVVYTCVHVFAHAVHVIAAEILLLKSIKYLIWLIKCKELIFCWNESTGYIRYDIFSLNKCMV